MRNASYATQPEAKKITCRVHLTCIYTFIAVQFMPFHDRRTFSVYVEQENYTCPAFCKHDIVSFNSSYPSRKKYSVGDFVILHQFEKDGDFYLVPEHGINLYLSRIVIGPKAKYVPCPDDYYDWINPGLTGLLCPQADKKPFYDFLTFGGNKPGFKSQNGDKFSLISKYSIRGHSPEKIGNLREYPLWSNKATDRFGYALLDIYFWTGINLFELTRKSKTS